MRGGEDARVVDRADFGLGLFVDEVVFDAVPTAEADAGRGQCLVGHETVQGRRDLQSAGLSTVSHDAASVFQVP